MQRARLVMHKSVNNELGNYQGSVPVTGEVRCIPASLHCHILGQRDVGRAPNSSVHTLVAQS